MTGINIEKFYSSFPTMAHRRNRFPFSKEVNFNLKVGEITPLCKIRVVPGQTYDLDMALVMKVAPQVQPPMDNAIFKAWAFYQPDRIGWDNYKYWFGEKRKPENPEEEPTYLVPKVTIPELSSDAQAVIKSGDYSKATEKVLNEIKSRFNTFYDCIGCVPEVGGYKIDKWIVNMDRNIYNTYFRNQTLENPLEIDTTDADGNYEDNAQLRKLCKPRDFFTQCLPTQSGTTPVEIPLGSKVPVIGTGNPLGLISNLKGNETTAPNGFLAQGNNQELYNQRTNTSNSGIGVTTDANKSGLIADLSLAMGAPLEGLYQAIAYNTLQYIQSRGGNRYFEQLSNIYGITNPDGVLQLPEYLGSLMSEVEFDTITQTSSTNEEPTPIGNRAANGYVEAYGNMIKKSFGEFGWIIIYGAVTLYPKYQQGIDRQMQTNDPLELFKPLFNLMGDEPIYRSEIYIQSDTVVNEQGTPINDEVFGYGKRNSRLLYPIDEIHGEQRSSYPESLDTAHFGQYFKNMPVLNKDFDKVSDESFKRSLQIQDETQFLGNLMVSGIQDIEIPMEAIPSPIPNLQLQ